MKRLVNVRFPVLLACALAAGVAFGYLFFYRNVSLFLITAVIPVAAVIFILSAIFIRRKAPMIIIALCAALLVAGAVNCFLRLKSYGDSPLFDGGTYQISATVAEKGKSGEREYIILKNVRADGEKVSGKIYAYLPEIYGDFCDTGYKVSFEGKLERYDVFPYGSLNYFAEQNVKYGCIAYNVEAKYKFSFFGSIRSALRDTLYGNLDGDTAAIAYAMLTGNTQEVDDDSLQCFRYGGIAHIFAVSGLHIGIVFGIISFITRKVKPNKYAAAAVCIFVIFFYAAVCGFTLSSVRAAIMCTVSVAVKLIYRKYDGLNSLAVSLGTILLITPLSLFTAGLQLSVCATGGIIILSKNIVRPFKKIPETITSAAGVSLAAQAGTMPVMLAKFGYLSGAGILLNIVVVPLISVVFVILFVGTLLSAALSFAAPLIIPVASLPLQLVISFLMTDVFEGALVSGFGAGAFLPLYFTGLLALSDKFNLKLMHRAVAFLCVLAILISYTAARAYPRSGVFKISVSAYHGGGSVLIKARDGNVLIITEGLSSSKIQYMLNKYYATRLDAVILLGGESCVTAYASYNFNCDTLIIYKDYISLQPYEDTSVRYERRFTLNGADFEFYDGYNLLASCGGVKVGVSAGKAPFEDCDLIAATAYSEACGAEYNVSFGERCCEYSVYDFGDLSFTANGGKLKINSSAPERPVTH